MLLELELFLLVGDGEGQPLGILNQPIKGEALTSSSLLADIQNAIRKIESYDYESPKYTR